MKKYLILFGVMCSLALTGCCTTHSADRWEYKTIVINDRLTPLGPEHSGPWTADDAAINGMLKDGWKVAGYGVDNSSQWFLLKRHKHKE